MTDATDAPLSDGDGCLILLEGITRRFPGVVANRDIRLAVRTGSFHAVIGENGAGKSTLLHILYGRYRPDSGRILLAGEDVTARLTSPASAIRRGIALVSQHYALIPALSILENIVLGDEPVRSAGFLDRRAARERIAALAARVGLEPLDWDAPAETLTVAAGQKVEILKALYRNARLLMLDEPTATLAPQEAESLFGLLHSLAAGGATILFVTHKLREVMAHSDAVTILRAGQVAGDFLTAQTNEQELLARMIGEGGAPNAAGIVVKEDGPADAVLRRGAEIGDGAVDGKRPQTSALLELRHVTVSGEHGGHAVRDVSLNVGRGDIVGVAGVDGSGQRELVRAIVGLMPVRHGSILLEDVDITRVSIGMRQRRGLAYIPEDRQRAGLVLDFNVGENYLLGRETLSGHGGGLVLNLRRILFRAEEMIRRFDVRIGTLGARATARTLSGGNQQKVVIGRALDGEPRLLIACQPARGLDPEAARFVYDTLRTARDMGLGVLLFSLDLEEILAVSSRVAVMFAGAIAGEISRSEATLETIGALMTGVGSGGGAAS